MSRTNTLVRLLSEGRPAFGIFSGPHTADQAAILARNPDPDFVFYSLETGPFDLAPLGAYLSALAEHAVNPEPHALALRIPPIRDGADLAVQRSHAALDAGVASIVFPHVESAAQAALAVRAMGEGAWPPKADGAHVGMLIIEDRAGVENARAIVSTPGVGVVFAGPGDLRRAYGGDGIAVEAAIQTILAACREYRVPCGITAGVTDIVERLAQGFQVIIVSDADAIRVAKSRTNGGDQ
jgi:2-keto-3-deoxy-L-rhamnonate aldolase RhmA